MGNTYPLSKTIEGFTLSLEARHLSPHTVRDYTSTLGKLAKFLHEDPPVTDIRPRDIEMFLASFSGLSNKSLHNYYIGLSAFWSWMVRDEIVTVNIVRKITPPKPEVKEIQPLTEAEIKAVMSSLSRSRVYQRDGRSVDHALAQFERNRAIILLMLDTGVRASELCDLKIEDLDNRNNRIYVRHGKGMKERTIPISSRTGQMLWRYLAGRKDAQPTDPLFTTKSNRPMSRTKLTETFEIIGRRAGVRLHPHKLRHTFAVMFLRNGGNVFTLQTILGHSSLEMVRHYVKLADIDVENAHRRASPVDNLRL